MSAHQALLQQIHHLNPGGIACLLDLATILAGTAMFRRTPANEPEPIARAFTVVPRQTTTQPPVVQAHDCYFLTNRRIEVTYASPLLVDWLQTTPDALKASWEPFIDGIDELRRVLELWMVAAQTHQPFNYTVRCRSALGRVAHAFIRVRPWFSSQDNEMVGFMGTVHAQCVPASVRLDLAYETA